MSEVGTIIEAMVIGRALELGASDVHLEPRGNKVVVRARVDGILHTIDTFTTSTYAGILSDLKRIAGLNSYEYRLPQKGSFRVSIEGRRYKFRVSTIPTTEGEKSILRLSQINAKPPTLKQLGFWGDNLSKIADILRLKRGLILVSGPDNAGKATTLFALLSLLNNDGVNIATIESAVEHKIPGANQTQINLQAGLTIEKGLESITNGDAEIIMASRITNAYAAQLLVDSALSGHLVFSSLSARSGGEAINQLIHMNVEPYLVANTLHSVISTRLIRELCSKCRESYKPTKEEVANIFESFNLNKSLLKDIAKYEAQAIKESIGVRDKKTSLGGGSIVRLWRAKGCKACLNTGYSGRQGLYEITVNSPMIERLTMGHADNLAINKESAREGMTSMRTDGLIKALRGVTSIEEVIARTEE